MIPEHAFDLCYADPPWSFKTRSDRGKGRSPDNHYATLSLAQLAGLNVSGLMQPDSLLAMWTTPPFIEQAIRLGQAWGASFVTVLFTWVKLNKRVSQQFVFPQDNRTWFQGLGYYTRHNAEFVLLFKWGKGLKRTAADVPALIVAPVADHSRKPDETYVRLERLFGDVRRIELFARQRRPDWTAVGNAIDGRDIREVLSDGSRF